MICSGGLDLVFAGQKVIQLEAPENTTIAELVNTLNSQYAKDKKDMFCTGNKVRPGILVLVNDVDWELLEVDKTVLKDKDTICFISTLHGG